MFNYTIIFFFIGYYECLNMILHNKDMQELLTNKFNQERMCYLFSNKIVFCIDTREHKANCLIINPNPYSFM